jgi:hypothetical protein
MRMVALASTREPYRAKSDLKYCFALLIGAITLLALIVAFLVMSPAAALSASNFGAARWLLAALGLLTGVLAFFSARLFLRRSSELPLRRLSIDASGVRFESAPQYHEGLLDFTRQFGMTLLGNRARDRLVLAVTTEQRAVYFGARVEPDERHDYRGLLSSASTVSDDDAVLDATGPDGISIELRLRDLSELVNMLLRADANAFDRCFLSDTHGAPVVLDGPELRIGRKGFDLRAPLEWRATLFQEPFGVLMPMSEYDAAATESGGVMVYQATWVRQGMSEAVLVSLLASLSSASTPQSLPVGEMPEVASAVLRDLRLMQAAPDAPPPRELRVGIERMYMLRLRAALDRAPRASHKDIPSGAAAR